VTGWCFGQCEPNRQTLRPGQSVGLFYGRRRLAWGQTLVMQTVPDVDGQEVTKPTTVANDESKRWRGGRPINAAQMEERVTAAYNLMLTGGSRRTNAAHLASRFGVSIRQADNYISQAQELLSTDFQGQKEQVLNQVNALRLTAVRQSMKRGNFQVVAHLLDSLARSMGEGSQEQAAAAAPQLSIVVEDKRQP